MSHAAKKMRSDRKPAGCGWLAPVVCAVLWFTPTASADMPAGGLLALSEIQRDDLPAPGVTPPAEPADPGVVVPAPEPIKPGAAPADSEEPVTDEPPAEPNPGNDPARPNLDPNEPVPAIEHDLGKLPAPVRELHDKLVAAAKGGVIEAVRPFLKTGEDPTQLSLAGVDNDPVVFLKSLAGDEGGQEILAILLEVLEAGYVHLDAGKPEELYVWPYFFAVPLDKLTDMQRVELFKLVTSGDYEDMKSFGAYIFYRVGISPDGKWQFFLAGE